MMRSLALLTNGTTGFVFVKLIAHTDQNTIIPKPLNAPGL